MIEDAETLEQVQQRLREQRRREGVLKRSRAHAERLDRDRLFRKQDRRLLDRVTQMRGEPAIYFISAGTEFVKIGWSADVIGRLGDIQTGCPLECRVRAITKGGERLERDLHASFMAHKVLGEWFRYVDEISRWVSANAFSAGHAFSVADYRIYTGVQKKWDVGLRPKRPKLLDIRHAQ